MLKPLPDPAAALQRMLVRLRTKPATIAEAHWDYLHLYMPDHKTQFEVHSVLEALEQELPGLEPLIEESDVYVLRTSAGHTYTFVFASSTYETVQRRWNSAWDAQDEIEGAPAPDARLP